MTTQIKTVHAPAARKALEDLSKGALCDLVAEMLRRLEADENLDGDDFVLALSEVYRRVVDVRSGSHVKSAKARCDRCKEVKPLVKFGAHANELCEDCDEIVNYQEWAGEVS